LFSSLSFLLVAFIFWPTCHLLINTSSLKLWQPITTTCYVPCTSTWKHVTSSLWMSASNFICWLFYIHNPPKLVVLTPHRSPCMPFVDYVNTFVDYVSTYVPYTDTCIDCVDKSTNCAHTPDDCANTYVDSIDAPNIPT
jgi:hypothetical protein